MSLSFGAADAPAFRLVCAFFGEKGTAVNVTKDPNFQTTEMQARMLARPGSDFGHEGGGDEAGQGHRGGACAEAALTGDVGLDYGPKGGLALTMRYRSEDSAEVH